MSYRTDQIIIAVQIPVITALAGGAVVAGVMPFSGTVVSVNATVNGAFTVSNIVATGRVNTTAITGGVATVPTSGSAFGTTNTGVTSSTNTFVSGDVINCTITGGVGAVSGAVTFVISRN